MNGSELRTEPLPELFLNLLIPDYVNTSLFMYVDVQTYNIMPGVSC